MTASRPWNREAVIGELRGQIWQHLSPTATPHAVLLDAAALLGLDDAGVARLADIHFVLHPDLEELLDRCPVLLRGLASSTTPTVEVSHDRVRGTVDWLATSRARAASRTAVVVTRPQVRDGDIQPNRVLALLLTQLRDRARATGLRSTGGDSSAVAARVTEIGRRASLLASHRALRQVSPAAPTPRELASLRAPRQARRNAAILDAYVVYETFIRMRDVTAIREAVESHGFAVASDGALFELLVLFRLRQALEDLGFDVARLGLFAGGLRFVARRGTERVTAWYQQLPAQWRRMSRYPATVRAHQMSDPHDLRPDLVLRAELADGTDRWTVVEAKTTTGGRPVSVLFRRALTDLLAYRAAFEDALAGQERWGLGVVWGSDLRPADHDVLVCTPDRLHDALERLLTA